MAEINIVSVMLLIMGFALVAKTFDPKVFQLRNPESIVRLIILTLGALLIFSALKTIVS